MLLWKKRLLSIVVLIIFRADLGVVRILSIYFLLRLNVIFPYNFVKNSLFIDLIALDLLGTNNSVILPIQIVVSTLIIIAWWLRVWIVVNVSLLIILVVIYLVNVCIKICVINKVRILCALFRLVWIDNMSMLYFNTTFSYYITLISQKQMIRNVISLSCNLIW